MYFIASRAKHRTALRSLLPYAWPAGRADLKARVALAMLSLVMAKAVTVATPIAFKAAIDQLAFGPTSPRTVTTLLIVLIALYGAGRVLAALLNQARDSLLTRVTQHAARSLTGRTFSHLFDLSLRFHLDRRTGGLSRVLSRGAHAIDTLVRMAFFYSAPTAIELALVLGVTFFFFGMKLSAIIAATAFLYIWFVFIVAEWRLGVRRELNDSDTEASAKAIDSLLNYETVKHFGAEARESARFDAAMARYEKAAVKVNKTLGVFNVGQAIIFAAGLTLCMGVAAHGVAEGTLTVGDFVLVNAMLIQLYAPLNMLSVVYRDVKQGLTDLEALFALLEQKSEVSDRPDARALKTEGGAVRFENVRFSYGPGRKVLRGVDFEAHAGKMTAIVGASGAGKSTISRLLFRAYDVTSGRVLIDGQDIRDVTQASLRAAIGMVPQDTVLFNDSIAYNIRYGRPDASDEEVREAARLAQLDGFVRRLPDGYDAVVGERGLKLSGGEKQRVGIARMILKNPPILMLDEATSALDGRTEKEIQAALERVAQNRTTLVIAHRLTTVVRAHTILVLENGRIVERGAHAELLARGGLYASMWSRQEQAADDLAAAG